MAEAIGVGLRRARMAVDVAHDGIGGLDRALDADYDVIVLDRDLPGIHGDTICAELIRAGSRSRVIVTAAGTTEDLVGGLGLGADDYLPKPFDFPELVARIGALMRRAQPDSPRSFVAATSSSIWASDASCVVADSWTSHPRSSACSELLLAARGRVVSSEELLERVWDENADPFTQAVKITVSRLRAKLGEPPIIETVPPADTVSEAERSAATSRPTRFRFRGLLPRPTIRLRLTLLYGALFLMSGAALLGVTYLLVSTATGNPLVYQAPNGQLTISVTGTTGGAATAAGRPGRGGQRERRAARPNPGSATGAGVGRGATSRPDAAIPHMVGCRSRDHGRRLNRHRLAGGGASAAATSPADRRRPANLGDQPGAGRDLA